MIWLRYCCCRDCTICWFCASLIAVCTAIASNIFQHLTTAHQYIQYEYLLCSFAFAIVDLYFVISAVDVAESHESSTAQNFLKSRCAWIEFKVDIQRLFNTFCIEMARFHFIQIGALDKWRRKNGIPFRIKFSKYVKNKSLFGMVCWFASGSHCMHWNFNWCAHINCQWDTY